MDVPTLSELADLVHNYFADSGIEVTYDAEQGTGEAEGAVFSVHNMAAHLAQIEREDWPDFVAYHFRHLAAGPPQLPSEYEQVRKRLRVRLACSALVDRYSLPDITRPVAPDLHEMLMIAIDGGAATIPPESLAEWGADMDTVWEDARNNTLWDEPRERQTMMKPTGERFTWVRGSWWVSTLLLDLKRYLSPKNPHGALAMVPVRDALFFHEILDESVVWSLKAMFDFGLSVHFEGPDPVSPHVYWWRDDEIRRIVAVEDGQSIPEWGPEFSEVLATLETESQQSAMN